MGIPVLSLPEITNVVRGRQAIVGTFALPGGESGIWHTRPGPVLPYACLAATPASIQPYLALWQQLLVVPQCTSRSLTLVQEQSWLPSPTAEVSPPEISYSSKAN